MKKITAVCLALFLVFSLFSCAGEKETVETAPPNAPLTTAVEEYPDEPENVLGLVESYAGSGAYGDPMEYVESRIYSLEAFAPFRDGFALLSDEAAASLFQNPKDRVYLVNFYTPDNGTSFSTFGIFRSESGLEVTIQRLDNTLNEDFESAATPPAEAHTYFLFVFRDALFGDLPITFSIV